MTASDGLLMDLHYNSGPGAWQYNVYNPVGSATATSHYFYQPTEGSVPNNASNVTSGNGQQTAQGGSVTREEHSVKYSTSLKVLNPINKKDFTMFTLRNLTAEDMNTPVSLKELIFEQVGECCLSKVGFPDWILR